MIRLFLRLSARFVEGVLPRLFEMFLIGFIGAFVGFMLSVAAGALLGERWVELKGDSNGLLIGFGLLTVISYEVGKYEVGKRNNR